MKKGGGGGGRGERRRRRGGGKRVGWGMNRRGVFCVCCGSKKKKKKKKKKNSPKNSKQWSFESDLCWNWPNKERAKWWPRKRKKIKKEKETGKSKKRAPRVSPTFLRFLQMHKKRPKTQEQNDENPLKTREQRLPTTQKRSKGFLFFGCSGVLGCSIFGCCSVSTAGFLLGDLYQQRLLGISVLILGSDQIKETKINEFGLSLDVGFSEWLGNGVGIFSFL